MILDFAKFIFSVREDSFETIFGAETSPGAQGMISGDFGIFERVCPPSIPPRSTVELCKQCLYHDFPAAVLHSGLNTTSHV